MSGPNNPKLKQGKSAMKQTPKYRYFNQYEPIWIPNIGWVGWFETPPEKVNPAYNLVSEFCDRINSLAESGLIENHDYWFSVLNPCAEAAAVACEYESSKDFAHYWLSRMVEWQAIAIYTMVWNKSMFDSRGTERSFPYRQRIEPSDANRIKAADKVAVAEELNWTRRFP